MRPAIFLTFRLLYFKTCMNENVITTKKLTAMSGVSWATLKVYVSRGWLQAPEIQHYGPGHGRGSRLLWDEDVVNQVRQIQNLKKLGNSLEQIDAILQGEKLQ